MTTDPRLPTLEEVMNGNPFDIIDSPWGKIERWRASTMATGTMGPLSRVYNDAAEAVARADEVMAQTALLKDTLKKLDVLMSRVDALEAKEEAKEAEVKAEADAEARAREVEEEDPLEDPPGDPTELEDANAAIGHQPTGDLHTLAAKTPEDDNEGDLPEELEDPPDPVPAPKGSVFPQPTAISLNKA
jgi:hypothetical protein